MSIAAEIASALRTRLATIKVASGYEVDVRQVYQDVIPMGLELAAEDMVSLFLLDDGAQFEHEHQQLNVARSFRVQVVDRAEATDADIYAVLRAVSKAIYANHPTAFVQDQFRFHDRVYWVQIDSDEGDLHMIDGNRIATFRVIVHYRTRPYDL